MRTTTKPTYTKEMFKEEVFSFISSIEYDPQVIARKIFRICNKNKKTIDKAFKKRITQFFISDKVTIYDMNEEQFKKFLSEI